MLFGSSGSLVFSALFHFLTPRPLASMTSSVFCFFFQAEDGIRDIGVTGVQTCALPICALPVAVSQRRTLRSLPPLARVLPSGVTARPPTQPLCPFQVSGSFSAAVATAGQIGRASCRERV